MLDPMLDPMRDRRLHRSDLLDRAMRARANITDDRLICLVSLLSRLIESTYLLNNI